MTARKSGGAIFDEGVARVDQFFHLVEGVADDGTRLEFERGAHAGEHGGVASIGLGELADSLSEAAGLARIDLDSRHSGLGQSAFEQAMIGARGLEDDARRRPRSEPFDQSPNAFDVIGEAVDFAGGVESDVEKIFGDVDADVLR